MKKEVFKNVLVGYNEYDKEVKDEQGNLLYIEHIKEPIYEQQINYVDYTLDEILEYLRSIRWSECFSVINRGVLWYNTLTDEQRLELDKWYKEWLDITDTFRTEYEKNPDLEIESIIPSTPSLLK